jgi:hypothetical protein
MSLLSAIQPMEQKCPSPRLTMHMETLCDHQRHMPPYHNCQALVG